MFFGSKRTTREPGASETSARKIMSLDASRLHCHAGVAKEMTFQSPSEEQAKSFYSRTVHNWEKKRQNVRGIVFWRELHLRENQHQEESSSWSR